MQARLLSHLLPMPGPLFGAYPERQAQRHGLGAGADAPTQGRSQAAARQAVRAQRDTAAARGEAAPWPPAGSDAWTQRLQALRAELRLAGLQPRLREQAFAAVGGAVERVLGLCLFDSQYAAARVMLDNRLAEMATGEGKTLAAALAAATAALAGVPVHVVTANTYLAGRDAAALAPLYTLLGLRCASVPAQADEAARRTAWGHDIVYTTARDLIFDYLRDRTRTDTAAPLLRGLCMAIVDEADSVLIDEARTPFILAEACHDAAAAQRHRQALQWARALQADADFALHAASRRAVLSAAGRLRCAEMAQAQAQKAAAGGVGGQGDDMLWHLARHREELVELALAALHLYRSGRDYVLRDGPTVEIVDPTTGRISPGRRWSRGLHQLIELKEGLAPSPLQRTLAQLTFQRFFPRYWRLCGMSGTLHEARTELQQVYRLPVQSVALRVPSQRINGPLAVYAQAATRWRAALAEVQRCHAQGAPVLVGCDSVAEAEAFSQRLAALGLPHQCLHASQDADEAARIARAGAFGAITVATQMAGRGTDICLAPGVAERGGLQVLVCQQNASARIDRQLQGRCARGGDPGRVLTLLALDAGLLAERLPPGVQRLLGALAQRKGQLPKALARPLLRLVQALEQRRARRQRALLLQQDQHITASLGFGARNE